MSQPDGRARHVAIITDGNGRWAQARGLDVAEGHRAGADVVKARLRDAVEFGIEELTVYSFSTENWSRSAEEVTALMRMFSERILGETPELKDEGVRMRFIGRRDRVAGALLEQMDWAEAETAACDRITLFIAFNYGGRAEIVDAAARFEGGSEEDFRKLLYAPEMHDPDLVIRTSGEIRTSNFLLWQSAYSELVFRDELWPDFTREAFRVMKPGGAIVNVSSIHERQTSPLVAPYAAAKAALGSLTRTASIEGGPKGIRVNAVLPGAVDTMMLWASPNLKSGAETLAPGDVGQPSQIADAVLYLAGAQAGFVTGSHVDVNGGFYFG